ncbi:hypothetical protein HPP92_028020 [Vanilla planifolia]|uniref:Uncharacterized protein n=1 Tax=Vanilla planifolia TaxID=51239 RepID=A0A835U443_VANPL|nr:hypothetical protein HPP92_028020 [Vanilla planifolia]
MSAGNANVPTPDPPALWTRIRLVDSRNGLGDLFSATEESLSAPIFPSHPLPPQLLHRPPPRDISFFQPRPRSGSRCQLNRPTNRAGLCGRRSRGGGVRVTVKGLGGHRPLALLPELLDLRRAARDVREVPVCQGGVAAAGMGRMLLSAVAREAARMDGMRKGRGYVVGCNRGAVAFTRRWEPRCCCRRDLPAGRREAPKARR